MRADARANRQALVEAAGRQFAAHGADVALSAVAEDAGVGIATLYRNFPLRVDLVNAVLSELDRAVGDAIDRFHAAAQDDLPTAWQHFVHELAALHPGALLGVFVAELVGQDAVPPSLTVDREERLARIQGVLERAARGGQVRPDLSAEHFQVGLATITRPLPDAVLPIEERDARWLIDVYLRGLAA